MVNCCRFFVLCCMKCVRDGILLCFISIWIFLVIFWYKGLLKLLMILLILFMINWVIDWLLFWLKFLLLKSSNKWMRFFFWYLFFCGVFGVLGGKGGGLLVFIFLKLGGGVEGKGGVFEVVVFFCWCLCKCWVIILLIFFISSCLFMLKRCVYFLMYSECLIGLGMSEIEFIIFLINVVCFIGLLLVFFSSRLVLKKIKFLVCFCR